MQRHDASLLAATQHNVAAALTPLLKAEPLKRADEVRAGNNRQLGHQAAMSKLVTIGAPTVRSGNSSR